MSDRMKEICGNCGRRYGLHINQSCYENLNLAFKPTGKYEGENMSDKIQMTEEQARELYKRCVYEGGITSERLFISNLLGNGYIIKSSLQQKVEEAEKMWETKTYWTPLEHIQREAIELLKQSHPEFKK